MSIKKAETNAPAVTPVKESKVKKVLKIIINTIINILIVAVLLVSILVAVLALTSKSSHSGLPNIFGYTFQYVETNSMSTPSPDGYEGGEFTDKDVIIGRTFDIDNPVELNVGDIITFESGMYDENGNPMIITHRIVKKVELSPNKFAYQTWGDNREVSEVPDQTEEKDYLQDFNIVAYNYTADYHGATLKGIADFFRTLRSQGGFFGIILIPMIIFFLYAIVRVVISAMNYKKGKEDDAKAEAEEEKQKAVDAAVAAALAAQNGGEESKPANAPADMTPEQMEQFKQFLAFQKAQQATDTPTETPTETPAEEPIETPKSTEE